MLSMGGGDDDNRSSVEEEWPFHKSRSVCRLLSTTAVVRKRQQLQTV